MSMRRIVWPNSKKFAFTIIDDTDNAVLSQIKPIYDLLLENNIFTTKTTWVFNSRNKYYGDTLENEKYKQYLLYLSSRGFEIALHNVGSGNFNRKEILNGLSVFESVFGSPPKIQINHSNNADNIYWGRERFYGFIKRFYGTKRSSIESFGSKKGSDCFWGDYVKKNILFIRNRTFNGINTLKYDKALVHNELGKEEFSNLWFSSSDGMDCKLFKKLLTKKNIDKLEKEGGCCILYTHFAYGFLNKEGDVDKEVLDIIKYLSTKQAWFAPASEILDYVYKDNLESGIEINKRYLKQLDRKWFVGRVFKKIKHHYS